MPSPRFVPTASPWPGIAPDNEPADGSMTTLAGGGFVVAWVAFARGGGREIVAQVYGADGSPAGHESVLVRAGAGGPAQLEALQAHGDGFVLSWSHGEGSGPDTGQGHAQQFDALGQPLSHPEVIDAASLRSEASQAPHVADTLLAAEPALAPEDAAMTHASLAAALGRAGFGPSSERDLSEWMAQVDPASHPGAVAQAMIDHYAPGVSTAALVAHLCMQIANVVPSDETVKAFVDLVGPGRPFEKPGDLIAAAAALPDPIHGIADLVGSVEHVDPPWL